MQENKKVRKKERKQALEQENDQDKKNYFFLFPFLGQRVFFIFILFSWSLSWSKACFFFTFFVFLYKFPPQIYIRNPNIYQI